MFRWIADVVKGTVSLCEGLGVTLKHVFKKHETLQYPEEKPDLPVRFRGRLVMPLDPDKNNDNRCTGCMICARACPNFSITKITKQMVDGKPKPKVDEFKYDMSSCMFCNLCVEACPFAAIVMSHDWDMSAYDKNTLEIDLAEEKFELKVKKFNWWKSKFKEESS